MTMRRATASPRVQRGSMRAFTASASATAIGVLSNRAADAPMNTDRRLWRSWLDRLHAARRSKRGERQREHSTGERMFLVTHLRGHLFAA
ncbi:hypothetical protein BE20_43815 [Sorangium cellulosum]|nr:hypothetical protein BE20_43815 [Sorangium cellulosum]